MDLPTSESVRKSVLENYRALSSAERSRRSLSTVEKFLNSRFAKDLQERKVALYRPLKSEVELRSLELALLAQGAQLCYPRITDSSASLMSFVHVEDPSHPESWEKGPYGENEPGSHHPEVSPRELDLVIVPGLAFGRSGERIGRGKGYYDRFLPQAPRALRVALALGFQLFPVLPQNPWDQKVQHVFTDTEEWVIR
jgi:5-formyltetrahydrofolate cyclo-ligase